MDGVVHDAVRILGWIDTTALAQAMRTWRWLYPIVEVVHIVGFVCLVGAAAMFDLRLLGVSRTLPVLGLGRHLLPWSVAGLLLIVPAGLMMFSAHPHEFADSGVFRLKLLLLALAGLNAAAFHLGVYRSVSLWDRDVTTPVMVRAHALLSLALWVAVITCGRLLAYT